MLQVALVDCFTGQIVKSGPESSAKVEIVVLEGDFDSEEGDNWTVEEFKNNIVREREGKKPLLTGDPVLNLKDGEGSAGDISFTDNSSWTRSRRFRLGARLVDNFDGTRVKEAKTESFIVRDHRGECECFLSKSDFVNIVLFLMLRPCSLPVFFSCCGRSRWGLVFNLFNLSLVMLFFFLVAVVVYFHSSPCFKEHYVIIK